MLGFGLKVAAIGIGTVFLELVLLVFVIMFITKITRMITGKKPEAGVTSKGQTVTQPAQTSIQGNDDDIIAVIAAAIAAMGSQDIHITAIRRITPVNAPVWSHAGRLDTMNSRQY